MPVIQEAEAEEILPQNRASKTAQQVKVLDANSYDQSLVPKTHKKGGEH